MVMDEMTAREREQLQRFETFRRLACAILLRRFWVPVVAFALAFLAFDAVLLDRARRADRFEARAVLLYHPRTAERVRALDRKDLFQILFRPTLKDALAARLSGAAATDALRQRLRQTVEFRQERDSPNAFNVVVRAESEAAAVARANAFAELCLKEYAAYRTADLRRWMETIDEQRKKLQGRLEELDAEEDRLVRATHQPLPERELDRLDETLGKQKAALAEAGVRRAKETARLKRLRADLATVPTAALGRLDELKRAQEELGKAEDDVVAAEALYTERNPRLVVARERRAALAAKYAAFCQAHGLGAIGRDELTKAETLVGQIEAAEAQEAAAREMCEALQSEIERNAKSLAQIQEAVPTYARLRHRREAIQTSLAGTEDTVADIRYLQASIPSDFTLVEPVKTAEETPLMTRKKTVAVVLGAGVAAGFVALLVVLLGVLFGRVRDAREVAFSPEARVLGSLPPPEVPFASEQEEKRALNGLCYRFSREAGDARTVLVARLPGATYSRPLHDAFDWNCAMGGKRLLRIEIVAAQDFAVTDDLRPLGGLLLKGTEAFFPVQDVSRLSPGELQLLANDVKELGKTYDVVVLGRRTPLSNHSIYFEQMLRFCDCAVLFVGARRTPRASLRQALVRRKEADKPLFAVVSGERDPEKVRGGQP